MSAGTGIRHSEFNPSADQPVHLYQIWLLPLTRGIQPGYEQKKFAESEKQNALRVVASPDGAAGSLTIHQNASIYLASLDAGATVHHELATARHAWLQVLRGKVSVNGIPLETSDGAAASDERQLTIVGDLPAEIMLFDMA